MAEKKSTYILELELKAAKANANIKKFNQQLASMDKRTKEARAKMAQVNLEMKKFASLKSELGSANADFQKGLNGTAQASGAAAAATMELGRAISDAPYGIRGMANNVSQLASQVFYMSTKVDEATGKTKGLVGSFKDIGKQLMGSMGVLVAIQVVIAAIDYFSNKVDETSKTLNELASGGITETYLKFKLLKEYTDSSTVSLKEKTEAVRRANEENEELNLKLDEEGRLTKASTIALEEYTTQLYKTAKAKAIMSVMTDKMKEIVQKEAEDLFSAASTFDQVVGGVLGAFNPAYGAAYTATEGAKQREEDADKLKDEWNKLKEKLFKDEDGTLDSGLYKYLFGEKDGGRGSRARRKKLYKQALLDLSKFIIEQGKIEADILIKNERVKLQTQQYYEKESLENTKDTYLEKNKRRYEDFLKTAKTEEEKLQAKKTFDAANLDAENEYQMALTALEQKHATERFEFERLLRRKTEELRLQAMVNEAKSYQSLMKTFGAGTAAGALNKPMSAVGAENVGEQQETQKYLREQEEAQFYDQLEQKKTQLSRSGMELLDVEKLIAQEKNSWLMSQQEFEIGLERDKIEAKKNINLEYSSWVGGLGDVFSSLSNQSKELATIGLILEKGSAIADIIIKTTAANTAISAAASQEASAWSAKAASAPLGSGAGFLAKSAAAIAMGAKRITKNKIGAGISIAKIAATTLSSRGGAGGQTPSGEGQGGRTFDFNLVGSTGQQQLATAIGEQFQQPVQAYVVSSQITSQQQMDNVIQTQAEF